MGWWGDTCLRYRMTVTAPDCGCFSAANYQSAGADGKGVYPRMPAMDDDDGVVSRIDLDIRRTGINELVTVSLSGVVTDR